LTLRWLNPVVAFPPRVTEPAPVNSTVPPLCVNVPSFTQLPLTVMVALDAGLKLAPLPIVTLANEEAVAGSKDPAIIASGPRTVTAFVEETTLVGDVPVLLIVKPLNVVVCVPPMV